jgi:low temperature requirement protein LtrA
MSWTESLRRTERRTRAVARTADEEHRTATSLELFYDLCFVVAVAQASSELHHLIVERHFADAVVGFSAVLERRLDLELRS